MKPANERIYLVAGDLCPFCPGTEFRQVAHGDALTTGKPR